MPNRSLTSIEEGKNYYLYHKDTSKPCSYVNLLVRVLYRTEDAVVIVRVDELAFSSYYGDLERCLVFRNDEYNKSWWLS
jgi:hypothetical protein